MNCNFDKLTQCTNLKCWLFLIRISLIWLFLIPISYLFSRKKWYLTYYHRHWNIACSSCILSCHFINWNVYIVLVCFTVTTWQHRFPLASPCNYELSCLLMSWRFCYTDKNWKWVNKNFPKLLERSLEASFSMYSTPKKNMLIIQN